MSMILSRMMRRSQTVEGSTDSEGGGGTTPTKSSKKERWSFAIKRRWFSSSTSRHSHDHDVAIVQPTKTTLGGTDNNNGRKKYIYLNFGRWLRLVIDYKNDSNGKTYMHL